MKKFTHEVCGIKYNFFIGQNAKENWSLIDNSDPEDLWFHLDNLPSGHVIVSCESICNSDIDYPNQILALGSDYCKSTLRLLKFKMPILNCKNYVL